MISLVVGKTIGYGCNTTFFLEYAGELHIIALRIEENAKIAIQTHTHHTPPYYFKLHTRLFLT